MNEEVCLFCDANDDRINSVRMLDVRAIGDDLAFFIDPVTVCTTRMVITFGIDFYSCRLYIFLFIRLPESELHTHVGKGNGKEFVFHLGLENGFEISCLFCHMRVKKGETLDVVPI
jgi:hypothetical protein